MKISKREKWFIIVGALALLANFTYVYIVEPVIDSHLEARQQSQRKQAMLQRYRPPVPGKDHYQAKLTELNNQLSAAGPLFLQEKKTTLAAAGLQGFIHKIGQESGLTIVRENVLPPKERDSFVEVPIELSMRGDMKAVRNFLYQIQTAPYLLTLPKLILRRGFSAANPTFTADLQVVGYIQTEENK